MSKHTPGPWHVDAGDYKYHIYYSREQSDHYFVEVDGDDDDEAKANARLIAAAPDLLAALKALLFNAQHGNGLDAHYRAQGEALVAIAKAEGKL
jgi:hypothetical protein